MAAMPSGGFRGDLKCSFQLHFSSPGWKAGDELGIGGRSSPVCTGHPHFQFQGPGGEQNGRSDTMPGARPPTAGTVGPSAPESERLGLLPVSGGCHGPEERPFNLNTRSKWCSDWGSHGSEPTINNQGSESHKPSGYENAKGG